MATRSSPVKVLKEYFPRVQMVMDLITGHMKSKTIYWHLLSPLTMMQDIILVGWLKSQDNVSDVYPRTLVPEAL